MFNMNEKFANERRRNEPYRTIHLEPRTRSPISTVITLVLLVALALYILRNPLWWTQKIADLSSAISQPIIVANERIQLTEGTSKFYPFNLTSTSRVRVQVNAGPKDVNVMLMTGPQLQVFQQASTRLFGPAGSDYTYTASPLSGLRILP